jgi:hypothetical protein
MSELIESTELNKFYQSNLTDWKAEQITLDDGGNLEQIFTQYAVDLLADAGETENVRVAYDEKALGTKKQHKINAYSISDNYETIDLFITVFKGNEYPERVGKDEIETASKRIVNFFRKGVYNEYVNEIEESSPIFDFAHTLFNSTDLKENLVRVNVIILSDGFYNGDFPEKQTISGFPVFFRIVDLNYLYNISEKSHIPIEIDFKSDGFEVPCIVSPAINDQYESYIAIIPGSALVTIYERYGSRLLEQNIRSFLQFTGKINNGIRNTILKEQNMFLAYNNGITATADKIELGESDNGKGFFISKVQNFQIVNGGQTTASIYHTLKKDKADITGIFVQLKLSVVKNKDKYSEIVSNIAKYANTQNKVSVSDLSSNNPYHIELEKLSRSIFTPHFTGQTNQTKWFYERARGQYKNSRIKEGFTKSKQKAFDLKNPKNQMINKEELAKYVNAFSKEIYDGKRLVIGPHFVVRGNQKNYNQFINYNIIKKPDSVYFEDIIAKAILFKSAEKIYGIKPNSIGDMRYITVPYAISLFNYFTDYKLDLYKIWKNQSISEELKTLLYELMLIVESFIKDKAPGSLYGEWAKKEDCWNDVKKIKINLDFSILKSDLESLKTRNKKSRQETESEIIKNEEEMIRNVNGNGWQVIYEWGKNSGLLLPNQIELAFNLCSKLSKNGFCKLSDFERTRGLVILDLISNKVPNLLKDTDKLIEEEI